MNRKEEKPGLDNPQDFQGMITDPYHLIEKELNWGYLTRKNRKYLEDWSLQQLAKGGYYDFKVAWLPLLMGVREDGVTSMDLCARYMMAKQAMSKTVKEMEVAGYLRTARNDRDGRSQVIFLTKKGEELRLHTLRHMQWMDQQLQNLLGAERLLEIKRDLNRVILWFQDEAVGQGPYSADTK